MADRLADLVVGLQRMAENARIRGDDLEYTHREEKNEYIRYLDHLLMITEKLHGSISETLSRFLPTEHDRALPQKENLPRVVTKGPLPEHLRPKEETG